jgi:hypothetical protein
MVSVVRPPGESRGSSGTEKWCRGYHEVDPVVPRGGAPGTSAGARTHMQCQRHHCFDWLDAVLGVGDWTPSDVHMYVPEVPLLHLE